MNAPCCLPWLELAESFYLYYFLFAQLLLNNTKSKSNAKGFGSYTPLHIAAQIDSVDICKQLVSENVFTFGGAKRSGSDRECKYFPIGMNVREPLWR